MDPTSPNESPTIVPRPVSRWRMAASGLVILLAGIVIGAAGTLLVVRPKRGPVFPPPPGRAAEDMVDRMTHELGLKPEQAKSLKSIFTTAFEQLQKIRVAARPEIDATLQEMDKQIAGVLTPDQLKQWKESVERFRRQFQPGMGRRPPGPRGGSGRRGDRPGGPEGQWTPREGEDHRRPPWWRPRDPNAPTQFRPPPPPEGRPEPNFPEPNTVKELGSAMAT